MFDATIVTQLIPTILVLIVGWALYQRLRRRTGPGTRDDYVKRHPDTVRNGRVHCHNCGTSSLHVRGIGRTFFTRNLINAHICRQCGTVLYRSVAKNI